MVVLEMGFPIGGNSGQVLGEGGSVHAVTTCDSVGP
jgi:hypothetical protein